MKMSNKPVIPEGKRPGFALLFLCILFFIATTSRSQETRSSGWVVIPVAEYQALHAKAYPVDQEPEASPVQATLTRVDYDLQIRGEVARGRVSLTVDVLKDGWVRVPIPSGLLVREARLDNKLVSLVPSTGKGGSQLTAVLSHSGRSVLVLDIALPVASSAGTESIALPPADSGVTRASVQLLRHGVEVQVSGGLLAEQSDTADESKWVAYGQGNAPLSFSWRRKTEDHRATQPLRLRGSLIELVSLGEDSTLIYAEVNLEVVQGAAADVRIQLPESVTVNQVLGATVADWEMKSGELSVKFLEPIEQSSRFVINGESRLPRDGEIEMPLLHLLNTEKDTGGIAVEVLGAGEIKDVKSHGMEEADASDLGETVASRQSPSLAAFRFRAGEAAATRSLTVNVARYTQQAVLMANIEEARYQVLMSKEGKSLIQARYAVRNNQRNFVKITLPPGAVVWSAALGGKPVRPGQSPDGSLLSADVAGEKVKPVKGPDGDRVPLLRPGYRPTSAYEISFVFMHSGAPFAKKGGSELSLPRMDVPINLLQWEVFLPEQYKVKDFGGDAMAANLVPPAFQESPVVAEYGATGAVGGTGGGVFRANAGATAPTYPGQLGGTVVDQTGAVISDAHVTVTNSDTGFATSTVTDASGRWAVSNFPMGRGKIRVDASGFTPTVENINYDASRAAEYPITLSVGSVSESVEVTADTISALPLNSRNYAQLQGLEANAKKREQNAASANVMNLQRRVAGVLPVAIEVPRTGTSFQFVRPLVLDEETKVTFTYKSK